MQQDHTGWSERDSQNFIDYGHYFVPDRDTQIQIICDLIPPGNGPFHVLELCCGQGLLAKAILAHFPQATVHAYDGSAEMLAAAQNSAGPHADRLAVRLFDLADDAWRRPAWPFQAVVSSLAIHHLDEGQKQALYRDVYRMLLPGGVFIIADLVQPANDRSTAVAAAAWDTAVRQQSLAFDGHLAAFEEFRRQKWNLYHHPDPMDKPSGLFEQLKWLEAAGFAEVDVYWMKAGHAIWGGSKPTKSR